MAKRPIRSNPKLPDPFKPGSPDYAERNVESIIRRPDGMEVVEIGTPLPRIPGEVTEVSPSAPPKPARKTLMDKLADAGKPMGTPAPDPHRNPWGDRREHRAVTRNP